MRESGSYETRCEMLADYMIKTQSTVRDTANKFGISKSTVHKDVTERLKNKNMILFDAVRDLLNKNKSERHLRGGEATKTKYLKKKNVENIPQATVQSKASIIQNANFV